MRDRSKASIGGGFTSLDGPLCRWRRAEQKKRILGGQNGRKLLASMIQSVCEIDRHQPS